MSKQDFPPIDGELLAMHVAKQLAEMLKDAAMVIVRAKELRGHYRRGDMIAFGSALRSLFAELDNLDAKQKVIKK